MVKPNYSKFTNFTVMAGEGWERDPVDFDTFKEADLYARQKAKEGKHAVVLDMDDENEWRDSIFYS